MGKGTVAVPEARVKAIRDYKLPVSKADLKSFLGLLSYYRKFIPSFASIAKPLNVLTHRDAKNVIQWEDGCLASFNKLVSLLCLYLFYIFHCLQTHFYYKLMHPMLA